MPLFWSIHPSFWPFVPRFNTFGRFFWPNFPIFDPCMPLFRPQFPLFWLIKIFLKLNNWKKKWPNLIIFLILMSQISWLESGWSENRLGTIFFGFLVQSWDISHNFRTFGPFLAKFFDFFEKKCLMARIYHQNRNVSVKFLAQEHNIVVILARRSPTLNQIRLGVGYLL